MFHLAKTSLFKSTKKSLLSMKQPASVLLKINGCQENQMKRRLYGQLYFFASHLQATQIMTSHQHEGEILASKKKKEKDRYGIFLITSVDELLELSRNRRLHLSLNDYVAIFLRITELRIDTTLKQMYGLSEILQKIEKEIPKAEEEEPSIGRLSLCLQRSQLGTDINLWVALCDHILANRFDCDHDEVYAAMLGFHGVKDVCQTEWQLKLVERVYKKLEIALIHHVKMQKYNIKTLRLICEVMYQHGRLTPDFLKEIEFLLNQQLMEASENFGSNEQMLLSSTIKEEILYPQYGKSYQNQLLQLLSSFAYFFAHAKFESLLLYNFTTLYVQESLNRSHIFEKLTQIRSAQIAEQKEAEKQGNQSQTVQLEEIPNPLHLDGMGLASLFEFWDFMLEANSQLVLSEQLRAWLFVELQKSESEYELKHLNVLWKSIDLLGLNSKAKAKFQIFLEKKLFEVNIQSIYLKIEHVRQYLDLRIQNKKNQEEFKEGYSEQQRQEEKEDFTLINSAACQFLDYLCVTRVMSFSAHNVYFFLHYIEENDVLRQFPKLLESLPTFLIKNIDKLEFDEICYFVLVCHRDANFIDSEDTSLFWSNLHLAMEHIKSIAFQRGFKLDPQSYFSQLLHQVDIAEFFNGGEN